MKHVIEHPLDAATARTIVDRAFSEYGSRYRAYDPKLEWTSETTAIASFKAKGLSLKGRLVLRPGEMDLDLEVPLLLRVFQKRATEVIDREVKSWLSRAQADGK